MTDWLEIANEVAELYRARKIIRDSDGNPARLDYRDGAIEAAALAASKQLSQRVAIDVLADTLAQYEVVVLQNPEMRRVS